MLKEISVEASLCTMAAKDDKIEVACPGCRQGLRLPPDRVGTVGCPRCGDRFEADTNTIVLSDADLSNFNIKPTSTITYRLLKSRRNTNLLLICLLFSILSSFLGVILLASAAFNNWQSAYLNPALVFCAIACVSWLAIIVGGKRHYIDIKPTEVYASKLGITIKYNNVDDIVKYFEQRGAGYRFIDQMDSYGHSRGTSVAVPQGDIQELHINSVMGKTIDISRDYITSMESINDLIAARVAMAKEPPIIWS
jgi:hypothetical protein